MLYQRLGSCGRRQTLHLIQELEGGVICEGYEWDVSCPVCNTFLETLRRMAIYRPKPTNPHVHTVPSVPRGLQNAQEKRKSRLMTGAQQHVRSRNQNDRWEYQVSIPSHRLVH